MVSVSVAPELQGFGGLRAQVPTYIFPINTRTALHTNHHVSVYVLQVRIEHFLDAEIVILSLKAKTTGDAIVLQQMLALLMDEVRGGGSDDQDEACRKQQQQQEEEQQQVPELLMSANVQRRRSRGRRPRAAAEGGENDDEVGSRLRGPCPDDEVDGWRESSPNRYVFVSNR